MRLSVGMTCWYVCSFDTKFSDGNDPPSSDIVVKKSQNSRSVSEVGTDRASWAGLGAAIVVAAAANATRMAVRRASDQRWDERRVIGRITSLDRVSSSRTSRMFDTGRRAQGCRFFRGGIC